MGSHQLLNSEETINDKIKQAREEICKVQDISIMIIYGQAIHN
jgi:hypothetical protein